MINELEVKRLDEKFSMKSRVYQFSNIIEIDTQLDQWRIALIDWGEREKKLVDLKIKPYKKIVLLHKNKYGRINKFHKQSEKGSLFACYDSIYTHKNVLSCINKNRCNTK